MHVYVPSFFPFLSVPFFLVWQHWRTLQGRKEGREEGRKGGMTNEKGRRVGEMVGEKGEEGAVAGN
jgi:hypothetical protein